MVWPPPRGAGGSANAWGGSALPRPRVATGLAVVHVYVFRRSYVCFCVRCCRQSIVSLLCCVSPSYIVFFLLHFSYTIASPTVIICVYQRSRCRQNVNTQPLSSQRDSCVYWYSIFMLSLDANWNAFDMSRSHSHNSLAVVNVISTVYAYDAFSTCGFWISQNRRLFILLSVGHFFVWNFP